MQDLIPDGYTESGYIAAVPGIHNAVKFSYRPMRHVDLAKLRERLAVGPLEGAKAIYGVLRQHVTGWDLKDDSGAVAGRSELDFAKLRPQLLDRLYAIVAGHVPSDQEPAAAPPVDSVDALLQEHGEAAATDEKN